MAEKKKGFDLSALDTSVKSADGVEFQLKDPDTGELLDGSFITVCGSESPQHKKSRDTAAEKIRKRQFEDNRKYSSPTDIEDLNLETAIGDAVSWRGIIDVGVELEFSTPNARKILEKYGFVVSQIREAVYDRSRFLPGDRG